MSEQLTPPTTLTPPEPLTPPAVVQPVATEQAEGMMPIDNAAKAKLDAKVAEFVNIVVNNPMHSPAFEEKLQAVHNMGNAEIRASASMSNRMLDRPVKAMEYGLLDDKSFVAKSLTDLRKTVEDLDPARQGDLLQPKRLFGLLPGGDRLRDYFLKYQSSQAQINQIINSLYNGQGCVA